MTDPTTTPTPPEGLTDEQLRDVLWKCLCERKANKSPFGAGSSPESDTQARIDDCRAAIAADRAARPAPTPEEIEATFRQWWAESYLRSPVGNHAVASHVAFALHLLGQGGVTP
jgi:hypothetical protein